MIKSISALIVIALSVGFGIFSVKPLYDQTEADRQSLQIVNDTFTDVGRINDLIGRTSQTLNVVDSTTLTRFNVFLPETIDPIRMANNLKQIGAKNGLVLMNIKVAEKTHDLSPQNGTASSTLGLVANVLSLERAGVESGSVSTETPQEKKYATTKASFTVTATYPGFRLLLEDLEKSLGLFNITSLKFEQRIDSAAAPVKSNSKTPTPSLYEFSVELETYSLR